jgi:proteasome activator subunit 4
MLWRQAISCKFFFPLYDHLLPLVRNEIPEMIASIEPVNSGFAITDHQDPRAQYYLALRQRFGKLLHEASVSLRQQGEENTVDAVHALVS